MATPNDLEFLLRVGLATGCGGLTGLERQYRFPGGDRRVDRFALSLAGRWWQAGPSRPEQE